MIMFWKVACELSVMMSVKMCLKCSWKMSAFSCGVVMRVLLCKIGELMWCLGLRSDLVVGQNWGCLEPCLMMSILLLRISCFVCLICFWMALLSSLICVRSCVVLFCFCCCLRSLRERMRRSVSGDSRGLSGLGGRCLGVVLVRVSWICWMNVLV